METAVRRMAMRVAARAVEQRLNADTSDHAGPMLPCACGQSARYVDRRGKNFESVLGPLRLERAYYYCELCEGGFCPRDRALGLEGGSLSPGVLRMTGLVGAMVSFEEGHELLHELAGVDVPTKHVERAAEALGREVAEDEKLVVEPPGVNEGELYTILATPARGQIPTPRRYFFSTLAPEPGFRKSQSFAGGPCMQARAIFSGVSGIGSGVT